MGVPIGFIEKWDKDEFEVIGLLREVYDELNVPHTIKSKSEGLYLNGKAKYVRIAIKRRDNDE